MMRVLVGIAFTLIGLPASAQMVTNCNTWGSNTTCTTNQRPPQPTLITPDFAGAAMRGYEAGLAARAERQRQEAEQQYQEARRSQYLQDAADRVAAEAAASRRETGLNRMGSLVLAGKCKEATELAFAMGEADMVGAIATVCKPASSPP
jgi:hypothetical protein